MDTPVFSLHLHPDGRRSLIYSDAAPLDELGAAKIERATDIQWWDGKWHVVFLQDKSTLSRFSHEKRAQCVKWEMDYINNHMTEFRDRLFPTAA